jgi:hypothetical protein
MVDNTTKQEAMRIINEYKQGNILGSKDSDDWSRLSAELLRTLTVGYDNHQGIDEVFEDTLNINCPTQVESAKTLNEIYNGNSTIIKKIKTRSITNLNIDNTVNEFDLNIEDLEKSIDCLLKYMRSGKYLTGEYKEEYFKNPKNKQRIFDLNEHVMEIMILLNRALKIHQ